MCFSPLSIGLGMLFAFLNYFPQRESLLLIFCVLTPSIFSFASILCHPILGLNLYYLCTGTLGLWCGGCSLHPALSEEGFDATESVQKVLILKKPRPEGTIPGARDALRSTPLPRLSAVVSPRPPRRGRWSRPASRPHSPSATPPPAVPTPLVRGG